MITLSVSEEQAAAEIEISKQKIVEHKMAIANAFVELGYAKSPQDVGITIGPEIEVTQVAGQDSWSAHTKEMKIKIAKEGRYDFNSKNDNYMPEPARAASLDKRFVFDKRFEYGLDATKETPSRNKKGRTSVELEPRFTGNLYTDSWIERDGDMVSREREPSAYSQIEFTSYPHSPEGVAPWINAMLDKAVNGARGIGLKRIETTALPNAETSPNSIHLNAVIGITDPNTKEFKNAFSQHEWTGGEAEEGQPSDLALCIGQSHLNFLKHSLVMFARSESDYKRFQQDVMVGPNIMGMLRRKELDNFGTAMFRGEKRETERKDSYAPTKPDKGPLRFELRVPSPGAVGHPNKTAYPAQKAMAYEMIEAYMKILADGVAMWKKREENRRRGKPVPEFNEEMLRPPPHVPRASMLESEESAEAYERRQQAKIIADRPQALAKFSKSKEARDYWGSDRIRIIMGLGRDLDEIERADRDEEAGRNKGPHVNRLSQNKGSGYAKS